MHLTRPTGVARTDLLFADGFDLVPGQIERATLLTRWLFPYIFFMGTAAFGTAALNAALTSPA